MRRIVVLDGYTLCPGDLNYDALRAFGDVQVYDRTLPAQTVERMADAQMVLTNKTLITREIMEACPALRYIGVLATGYNVVDVDAAAERGITVTNVPAYSTQAVVQHAFALLLASMSRVSEYDAQVKQGRWQRSPDFCFFAAPMEEIAGKTLGIAGFGHIGQAMAKAALGFDMRVLVHTRTERPCGLDVSFVSREELLTGSDILSLHCPLTEQTRGFLDAQALSMVKKGVRIINTARGPLVDGHAMAEALACGRVACYMADVLETEPPQADHPLLTAPNVILTPHVAWAPLQTRTRLLNTAVQNVRAFIEGRPQNVVSRL